MTQLLLNPDFKHDPLKLPETRIDPTGAKILIAEPLHWKYTAETLAGMRWPESFNRSPGFEFGGTHRAFIGGYTQQVEVQAGVKYRLRASLKTEVHVREGSTIGDYDVRVYFRIDDNPARLAERWLRVKHDEPTLDCVIEATKRGRVWISIRMENKWRLEKVTMTVLSVTLEPTADGTPIMIEPAEIIEDPQPEPETVTIPAAEYARLQASEGAYRALQAEVLALKTMLSRLSNQLMSDINAHSEALAKSQAPLLHMITTAEELRKTVAQPVGQLEVVNKQTEKTA